MHNAPWIHLITPLRRCTLAARGIGLVLTAVLLFAALPVRLWAQEDASEPSVRVTLDVDRENITQFETFELTVTMLSNGIRLDRDLSLEGLPASDRFVMGELEALPIQRTIEGRTIVETRRYRARCRALKPGPLRIAPAATATQIVQRRSFFGRQWVKSPIRLPVPPLTLPIAPLPPPPQGVEASGAVGTFTFDVTPAPLDVAVGDLIKLTTRIAGDGYLDELRPPTANPGPAFKTYPPRLRSRTDTAVEFEQALIPLSESATEIPSMTFTYYDARSGSYQTRTQGPFRVTFHAQREVDRSQPYRSTAPDGTVAPAVTTLADRIEQWKQTPSPRGTETVIVLESTLARLAPADMARPLFRCKPGDIVTIHEEHGPWLRIQRRNDQGWITTDAVMRHKTAKEE